MTSAVVNILRILIAVAAIVMCGDIIGAIWTGTYTNSLAALVNIVLCLPCWLINLIAKLLEGAINAIIAIVATLLGVSNPPSITIGNPCNNPNC